MGSTQQIKQIIDYDPPGPDDYPAGNSFKGFPRVILAVDAYEDGTICWARTHSPPDFRTAAFLEQLGISDPAMLNLFSTIEKDKMPLGGATRQLIKIYRDVIIWYLPPRYEKDSELTIKPTIHRKGGPAVLTRPNVMFDLSEIWVENGLVHREDGPAIRWHNGSVEYLYRGLRHRERGPASIWIDGDVEYWTMGKHHPGCMGTQTFNRDFSDFDELSVVYKLKRLNLAHVMLMAETAMSASNGDLIEEDELYLEFDTGEIRKMPQSFWESFA